MSERASERDGGSDSDNGGGEPVEFERVPAPFDKQQRSIRMDYQEDRSP